MNREKNYVRNFSWGFISKIILILLPFLVRTVLIKQLGIIYVGLGELFSTIFQVLSLAELGFGSAFVYSMYKPVAENDNKVLCALLKLYKKIYFYIGLIIIIVGLIICPFLTYLIHGNIPNDVNIYLLFFIYLFNTVSSYIFLGYRGSIFVAHQRNDINTKVTLFVNISMYILQIIFLCLFKNYYVYIIILPISTITINLVVYLKSKKYYPNINCIGEVDEKMKKNIYIKVKSLLWYKLGNTIIFSFDSIVISAFLGLEVLGKYNNYFYIYTAVASIFSIFYDSITPGIGNSLIVETKEKNYSQFSNFNLLNFFLIGICSCMLICLYQPFMFVWQGKINMLNNEIVILLVILFIIWHSRRMLQTYKDAGGLWEQDKYRPITEALVNLILNIIMVNFFGLIGIVLSTILSMIIVGIPWETKCFIKNYFNHSLIEYFKFYFNYLLKCLIVCFIPFIICFFIKNIGISSVILKFLISSFLSILISFIFYKNSNIIDIFKLILKIGGKNNV